MELPYNVCTGCGFETSKPALVCFLCGPSGVQYPCEVCRNSARYGNPADKVVRRCKEHKQVGDVDLRSKRCKGKPNQPCFKQPKFAKKGETKATHCSACIDPHDRENWIAIGTRKCVVCKHHQPGFSMPGQKPTHCSKCKIDGMIRVYKLKCGFQDCDIEPVYGMPGDLRPSRCTSHKLPGMKDIKNARCMQLGCDKKPNFGSPSDLKAEYCKEHAPENYCNVNAPKCLSCDRSASYGIKRREYCSEHKEEGMKVIGAPYCEYVGEYANLCSIRATYGYTDNRKAIRCRDHALPHMVDVLNSRCTFEGCTKLATFGKLFSRTIHCGEHADRKVEYVNTKPICNEIGCRKAAYYAEDLKAFPTHCDDHRIPGSVNVVEKVCVGCGIPDRIPAGFDSCYACRGYKDDKIRKAKEMAVKDLLDRADIKYTQHDKRVDEGCSRYRPDFVIDKGTFFIVVECDENQHSSYPKDCEVTRMLQLYQDFGMPVQFIRYNPDAYVSNAGIKVTTRGKREKDLIETVRRVMSWEIAPHFVAAIYIAYDGYNGTPVNQDLKYEDRFSQSI